MVRSEINTPSAIRQQLSSRRITVILIDRTAAACDKDEKQRRISNPSEAHG
jgi:hypothetical protein